MSGTFFFFKKLKANAITLSVSRALRSSSVTFTCWIKLFQTSPVENWKSKSPSHVWLFATSWIIQSMEFSRPEYWSWVDFPFFRGSSQPRDWTQISHIAGRFFTSWAARDPKNTGVGSLSLLQWIFLVRESNQGLLHCRWILYQLELLGKPFPVEVGGISPEPHHPFVCIYLIAPLSVLSEKQRFSCLVIYSQLHKCRDLLF